MTDLGLSTIAQLLFPTEQSIDFARTVAELEGVLSRLQPREVRVTWDCEDFVCLEIPGTRIQMAWSKVDRRGYKACLSVSVGPGQVTIKGFHEDMCSRLVDRLQTRFDPVAVLWCQADGVIGSQVIDELLDALPHLGVVLPDIDTVIASLTEQEARLSQPHARPKAKPRRQTRRLMPITPANRQPDLPVQRDEKLQTVRHALYAEPDTDAPYSTQLRLAVHCLNATLILVWTPMGAALMTYSILKGEDMRLSSRVMAVTGILLAFAHSPVGMTFAAMAKSMG